MNFELALFSYGIMTMATVGVEIMFTYATQGFGYGFAARRPETTFSPFAQQLKKAYNNQVETAAYAVPILIAAALIQLQSETAQIAAAVFIVARAFYIVLYLTGVSFLRVPPFLIAQTALLYIAYVLMIS